jgi:hypothetical protein
MLSTESSLLVTQEQSSFEVLVLDRRGNGCWELRRRQKVDRVLVDSRSVVVFADTGSKPGGCPARWNTGNVAWCRSSPHRKEIGSQAHDINGAQIICIPVIAVNHAGLL